MADVLEIAPQVAQAEHTQQHTDGFHLVIDVIDRVPSLGPSAAYVREEMRDSLIRQWDYTRMFGDDSPEIRDWTWTA